MSKRKRGRDNSLLGSVGKICRQREKLREKMRE